MTDKIRLQDTVEVLERLHSAGLIDKRILPNGQVQWRINEKGRTVTKAELKAIDRKGAKTND